MVDDYQDTTKKNCTRASAESPVVLPQGSDEAPLIIVVGTGNDKLVEIAQKINETCSKATIVAVDSLDRLQGAREIKPEMLEIKAPYAKTHEMPYIPREQTYDHKRKYGKKGGTW